MRTASIKLKLISFLSLLILVACATPVFQSEIAQAKFLPQPKQVDIDKELNVYLKENINNPKAAKKECAPPRKAWARALSYEPAKFGWIVVCDINAKDKSDEFSPLKAYMFLFTTDGNFAYDSSTFVNINNNMQFLDLLK